MEILVYIREQRLPWLILFIFAWGIFFTVSDWKQLRNNYRAGLMAAFWGGLLENFFIAKELFAENLMILPSPFPNVAIYLMLGPFFVMGVLFVQFLPDIPTYKGPYALAWGIFGVTIEWIFLKLGYLQFHNWSLWTSYLSYWLFFMMMIGTFHVLGYSGEEVRSLQKTIQKQKETIRQLQKKRGIVTRLFSLFKLNPKKMR